MASARMELPTLNRAVHHSRAARQANHATSNSVFNFFSLPEGNDPGVSCTRREVQVELERSLVVTEERSDHCPYHYSRWRVGDGFAAPHARTIHAACPCRACPRLRLAPGKTPDRHSAGTPRSAKFPQAADVRRVRRASKDHFYWIGTGLVCIVLVLASKQ